VWTLVAHTPNPLAAPSPGALSQSAGHQDRRLSGGSYASVIVLVVVGGLWLLLVGGMLAYGGVNFFSPANWVCAAAAVLAIALRSFPRLMSVLLSVAAAGVVVIAGFNLGETSNVGSSGVCSDDLANAVARVPGSYWATWVLVGGLIGGAMVVGALLTPRAVGSGLLGVGGWALGIGNFLLWILLNGELKSAPASFPVGRCGEPVGFGGAILVAAPVALLALAAVIPAIWARPSAAQTTRHRRLPEEEAWWRW
jgi:hypothetical protein